MHVVDSHTGGEPTRVVVDGGPDLGTGPLSERRERFATEYDAFRSAVVNEPRGSDELVGAVLCEPVAKESAAAVVFFNNVGVLNMCGHGTIGLAVTLAHLGRIGPGKHQLETPVGNVEFELADDERHVTVENVPSYRHTQGVELDVPGHGTITGDVAWGGNWFFLTEDHGQAFESSRVDELTRYALAVRAALERDGITGEAGGEIDHIELFAKPDSPDADSRSFVLCPGGAWDRSPCGTGTSAKLACLAADGKLNPGDVWRQQSVIGSVFSASYRESDGGRIIPSITGSAWVTAEATLIIESDDPLRMGFST
ncbi:MAG: 4-hydroxyproline epimerase [Pirellulales bacterium]|nr:4-hydroxyproline epimerase [Pirellulales bacterium]